MIQALVFDLDDTLYSEIDFVTGGYKAVARYVSGRYGANCNDVFYSMMASFASSGRRSVLPKVVKDFLGEAVPISELVEVYREHLPEIRLYPGYGCLLERLSREYKLGIITDGLPDIQRRKVQALGLEYRMDKIIYTWDYGQEKGKPHPFAFSLMLDYLRTDPCEALYVGDNPVKDCRGAHAAGMRFVQVRAATQSTATSDEVQRGPDFVIDSIYQLPQILEQMDPCHTMKS
jgi:putative hydrolase of the HAD superfamily